MKLYWDPIPPPCQSVLLTARYLGVELELQRIDVMKGEQMSSDYLKVNPLHTVPVLEEEDGFRLTESRAIMIYLAQKAGARGAALLPEQPRAHALCQQWLWFDSTCLWHRLKCYHLPVVTRQAGELCTAALPALHEALQVLDEQLKKSSFVIGETPSLADFGLVVTVAQAIAVGLDLERYSEITTWYQGMCRTVPQLEDVVQGSSKYGEVLRQIMHEWKEAELTKKNEHLDGN